PKNIWRFSVRSDSKTITEVSGQTFESDGSAKGNFKQYGLTDYKAQNIQAFQPFIANGLISRDLSLLESAYDTNYCVDIMYGLTDKLSVGMSVPFLKRTLRYSQDYINTFTSLDQLASLGGIPGITGDDVIIPPNEAKGEGIGDIIVGFKYKIFSNLAVQSTAKTGVLKLGKDHTEISETADNAEELVTGATEDEYTLEIYYDFDFTKLPVKSALIYMHSTPGHASGLDNDFDIQKGDAYYLIFNTDLALSETYKIDFETSYFLGNPDKKKANDKWEEIPYSDVNTWMGKVQFNYMPAKYVHLWVGITAPLYNKAVGSLYNYPGRLNTDKIIDFGTHIFL
ncbi:hypothetical protein ACFL4D_02845, partial [Candidatus Margulisiibacteriota bacterium]